MIGRPIVAPRANSPSMNDAPPWYLRRTSFDRARGSTLATIGDGLLVPSHGQSERRPLIGG